jgi:hypothetical protein
LLPFAASAAWYMSFSRSYAAALGKTADQMAEERRKPGNFPQWVVSVAFIWFGFILTTMTVNFSFSGRDRRLWRSMPATG